MSNVCPCGNYKLSITEIFDMSPKPYEINPRMFVCPRFKNKFRITSLSRLYFVISVILISLFTVNIIQKILASLSDNIGSIVSMLVVLPVLYLVVWPKLLELEPWRPFFVWLPASRAVGYLVYFILPIVLFLLFFYISTRYEWFI